MRSHIPSFIRVLVLIATAFAASPLLPGAETPKPGIGQQPSAAKGAPLFGPSVRRIVFLGDSITYRGGYVSGIVAYQRAHEPRRNIEFINVGLSSETCSGLSAPGHAGGKFPRPDLHERLDRVLEKTHPDLVFTCYGMNDGIFMPFDEWRFQAFKDGMNWLHETVEKSGAKIIHITPPIFDEVKGGHAGYAGVLDKYSEWLVQQRGNGWQVIDLHTPMQQALTAERSKNPAFAFSQDGVHPGDQGQWLMAREILKGLGATGINGLASPAELFGSRANAAQLMHLIQEQQNVMKDAWLTEIGHKRPQPPGLPLPEAQKQANVLESQIQALLPSPAQQ